MADPPRRRFLVSQRRGVAASRSDAYARAWAALHAAVSARGAHAWRFASARDPELHLEFLEFAADADPRHTPEVAAALAALDAEVGAAEVEEWTELP